MNASSFYTQLKNLCPTFWHLSILNIQIDFLLTILSFLLGEKVSFCGNKQLIKCLSFAGHSKEHRPKTQPCLHQVLQPHGLHSGHGPGSSRHPDHGLRLDAQSHSGGKSETTNTPNHDHHHPHVHRLPRAKGENSFNLIHLDEMTGVVAL